MDDATGRPWVVQRVVDGEFSEPRLIDLYDQLNPLAAEAPFYGALADERPGSVILDLGSGTGMLACALAARGHEVIGVEPALGMLAVAADRPGGERVRWVHGDAGTLGGMDVHADLAIMTGHVAQVFLTDSSWSDTLTAIHGILAPGGRLAFESRNPSARAWETWTRATATRTTIHPEHGSVEAWPELVAVDGDLVRFDYHFRFAASHSEVIAVNTLRFRPQAALERSIVDAGFVVGRVFGDFDGSPHSPTSPEVIVVALRP